MTYTSIQAQTILIEFSQFPIGNSIVKNKFNRVDLLKVQASTYNYDAMSLCATSSNDDVEIPETSIDGYNFVPVNHPSGNSAHS